MENRKFSIILKELRNERHITQEALAKIVNLERSTIGKYESTNIIPSVDVLDKLADFFGVTVDYLLGRKEVPVALSRPGGYENLSDEEREQIDSLIELFLSRKK